MKPRKVRLGLLGRRVPTDRGACIVILSITRRTGADYEHLSAELVQQGPRTTLYLPDENGGVELTFDTRELRAAVAPLHDNVYALYRGLGARRRGM